MMMCSSSQERAINNALLRELPYYGVNISENEFRDISKLPTKKSLDRLTSIHDLDLFSLNSHTNINPDYNLSLRPIRSNYYSPHSFSQLPKSIINDSSFSLFHNNIRSLKRNGGNLQSHLLNELNCHFSVIGITETRIKKSDIPLDFNMNIPNYNFEFVPTPTIYMMGDININLLRFESCNHAQNFLTSLQSLNLTPTIDKPTRVYNNSATLIDNIFVNKLDDHILSGNIISDISDHFSQFCIFRSFQKTPNASNVTMRDFSKYSEKRFIQDVSKINWNLGIADTNKNVDNKFSNFYNKLNEIINKHAPLRPISKRRLKQMNKPWITSGIRKSIKVKNQLFHSGYTNKYKLYRNKILTLTRVSKKLYYHTYFEQNANNLKNTWKGINILINRNKKNIKQITALRKPNNAGISYNPSEIPDIMNNHFATIGNNLSSKIPQPSTSFTSYLPCFAHSGSFVFEPVLPTEIELGIISIPLNKATGFYSCPTPMLKCIKCLVSTPLSQLINMSVDQGIYFSKLKHAKVVPIYKCDDETDSNNYRPISL